MTRLHTGLLAIVLALAWSAPPLAAQESIAGAWTVVDRWGEDANGEWRISEQQQQPSLVLFADGYYSMAAVDGVEPRPAWPEGAEPSDLTTEQWLSIVRYTSTSGTYEFTGTELTIYPIVSFRMDGMEEGFELTYEVDWEGEDALVLTARNDERWFTVRFRRLN